MTADRESAPKEVKDYVAFVVTKGGEEEATWRAVESACMVFFALGGEIALGQYIAALSFLHKAIESGAVELKIVGGAPAFSREQLMSAFPPLSHPAPEGLQ